MNIKYAEFFRNLKSLPPEGSSDFYDLIDWEVEKCLGGVNVAGVHIPGFLYWHLNHCRWGSVVDPAGVQFLSIYVERDGRRSVVCFFLSVFFLSLPCVIS